MRYKKFSTLAILFSLLVIASCEEKNEPSYIDPLAEIEISGTINYSDGTPAEGVVVSDGYNCTVTDASGKYNLEKSIYAWYVSYSIPSNVKVVTGTNGLPCFYKKTQNSTTKYDFTLEKQDVEKQFRILGVGDIQVKSDAHIKRYATETMADLKEFKEKHTDMPVYAIHMGDLVANTWDLYPSIIPKIDAANTDIPMFMTIGNHDHVFPSANNIAAQRTYESACGPVNYSFNRGDVHIVVMDDIIHSAKASSEYDGGFLPFQYEWLKQDLSYVDKSKSILLAVHIPFRDGFYDNYKLGDGKGCYYQEVLDLLAEFADAKIISGHVHVINNTYCHPAGGKTIQEYALGAACGAHWTSTCCYDGAPNGYGVLEFDGTTLKNYRYKATKRDDNFQMRIYLATDFPDFTCEYKGTKITCKWGLSTLEDTYVVNIWNMTDEWTTEVFLDGTSYGPLSRKNFADGFVMHYYLESGQESHLDTANGERYHMYYFRPYKKVESFTEMKVVATDPFGNRYECSTITDKNSRELYGY